MNLELNRRMGRFSIPCNFIRNGPSPAVICLLSQMIIVRCENIYAGDLIEYTAFSLLFDEQPTEVSAPFYRIEWIEEEHTVNGRVSKLIAGYKIHRCKEPTPGPIKDAQTPFSVWLDAGTKKRLAARFSNREHAVTYAAQFNSAYVREE